MLKISKKGDGGAGLQELMFIILAVGIAVLLFSYGLRVGSSLFTDSREETLSKDIAYASMAILSSPTNMMYTYAPHDYLKDYTVSIDSEKVKVISADDSSASYPIMLPEGMSIEPITLQGPLSIPMVLKQNTLKFKATTEELEQKCSTIASNLMIPQDSKIYVNVQTQKDDLRAQKIADSLKLKLSADPENKYKIFESPATMIYIRIEITKEGTYIIQAPEKKQYSERFICLMEQKSFETLGEHFSKFKAEKTDTPYIKITISDEIATQRETKIATDIFEAIESTIQ